MNQDKMVMAVNRCLHFDGHTKVDLETRYATLSYGIGHNLSPELSTFAPSAP